MNKLKVLLPILLVLLLLAVFPAAAEEAENLTADLKVKTADQPGKVKAITDGKYTTFWESSSRKDPWVVLSSDKPIYGLYLCFQKMPDTYVIQKESGDGWVTVAEGGTPRYHHAFFELDGLKKIRILSTMEKKNVMGFNEIFAFGKGEVPDWVQQWEEPAGSTDILFLSTHPDDDVLFLGSAITWYAAEQKKNVMVAYLTYSNTTRRSEALNGLWAMGVRTYPEFGPFSDKYSNPSKVTQAYKDMGGEDKVLSWVTDLYRKYRPEVVVTQDIEGEYGHPQHKMMVDAAIKCWDKAADSAAYPESGTLFGPWEVKKLYIHLYGDETKSTAFNFDAPMESMGGKSANEVAEDAFTYHVTQAGKGHKFNGKQVVFSVAEYGVRRYPNNRFGLYASRVGEDVNHDDFLEHIETAARPAATEAPAEEEEDPEEEELPQDEDEEIEEEVVEEEVPRVLETEIEETELIGEETEDGTEEETEPETAVSSADGSAAPAAPEWADVKLNARGYLDEGEYILEDEENGHWMYVSPTLRIQIERNYLKFTKARKSDPEQAFYCFITHVWCDCEAGELPHTVYSNPDKPRTSAKFIKEIAREQKAVLAFSTDYYTYRAGRAKSDKSSHVGIVIRNGEVLYDDPQIKERTMPNYETLALYKDGHVESHASRDMGADQYIADGATDVYTFGPCLVRNGAFTEYIATANRVNNPRHAFGMVEPGHYVDVLCEGRVGKKNGMERSTGVMMENLAQIMLDEGCTIAVNLDGGQTAVVAFMGKQLNRVVKSDPSGRPEVEVLAFGTSEKVGTDEK
ncbi:MAG: phosphodiester glycosidase family protein [Clostridia bacterium]|nr:phosphodiester glycosidase family protein [Clostridia bacterium]